MKKIDEFYGMGVQNQKVQDGNIKLLGRPRVEEERRKSKVVKCLVTSLEYEELKEAYKRQYPAGELPFEGFIRGIILKTLG